MSRTRPRCAAVATTRRTTSAGRFGAALILAVGALSSCGRDTNPAGTSIATVGESRTPSAGFTAVTVPRAGQLADGTSWTIMVPQVRGGDLQVRAAYNGEVDAIVAKLTSQPSGNGRTIGDGSLGTAERSRTVVGERTLAGVMIVLSSVKQAAYPSTNVETVVLDSLTGEVIDEPFIDPEAAKRVLVGLAAANDPSGRLRDGGFSYSGFASWIPLPEGLHVYVDVPHVLGDYVPVTIPWDKVTGLLKPDVRQVLVG